MANRPVPFYLDYLLPSFQLRLERTPFPRLILPQHLQYLLYGLMLPLDIKLFFCSLSYF